MPSRSCVTRRAVGALALLAGFAPIAAGQEAPPIRGFSAAAAAKQRATEARLARSLSRDSTGRFFREYTDEPHAAGTLRNKQLADTMAARLLRWGFDEVQVHRYDVHLPWPRTATVTMVAPDTVRFTLREDAYDVDPHTAKDPGATYLGMSASGDVTGELVYANSGNPEDYDWLEAQGIDLRGKIALVRYSVPYSYRGFKALTAQERGLAAVLVYSDPKEDGYAKGDTFPTGPWGPASHIQRGSITYDFILPGDPLTPGYASLPGAPRVSPDSSPSVPRIVAMPLSYRDARVLLERLGGPEAPAAWRGALPITYRAGAGPTAVRVHVDNDDGTRPIWVVEGRIRGSERPDELVVLGNHRDAWVYGAVDPSSGTATQLELARVLGAMARDGMRPKRTLVFASWDAEEWHLTGSTEWGEHFADALRAQAVAYLNVDGSTSGPTFEAGTVASLNTLVAQVARDVADPAGGSVLEQWGKAIAGERRDAAIGGGAARDATATDPDDYPGNALGSGSDYTVFLNHLGLPIVEMSFNGPYGVYHSVYDDAYWMEHFGDPGYRYMTTMAEVWGRMALRLANAEVLPVDARRYAERVGTFIDHLAAQPGSDRLAYDGVRAAHKAWAGAARVLEQRLGDLLAMPASPARTERLQRVNDQLRRLEQAFLLPDGIPGRPWFRHALYAPKYTYAAMTLPGVREAADRGDALLAQRQLTLLTQRLAEATAITFRAAEAVRGR